MADEKISAMASLPNPSVNAIFPLIDPANDPAVNYGININDLINTILNNGTGLLLNDMFGGTPYCSVVQSGDGFFLSESTSTFDLEMNSTGIYFQSSLGQQQINISATGAATIIGDDLAGVYALGISQGGGVRMSHANPPVDGIYIDSSGNMIFTVPGGGVEFDLNTDGSINIVCDALSMNGSSTYSGPLADAVTAGKSVINGIILN